MYVGTSQQSASLINVDCSWSNEIHNSALAHTATGSPLHKCIHIFETSHIFEVCFKKRMFYPLCRFSNTRQTKQKHILHKYKTNQSITYYAIRDLNFKNIFHRKLKGMIGSLSVASSFSAWVGQVSLGFVHTLSTKKNIFGPPRIRFVAQNLENKVFSFHTITKFLSECTLSGPYVFSLGGDGVGLLSVTNSLRNSLIIQSF